ncbi:hypothetical protein [uncultured Brevundimonas sp.]|uniref:hypothetical protein n=1 Tax=uncultured Brevundimonas sp. TaxID=213418 RepID=UPI0026081AF9|nr:hypothetical protein [uncultured Brevundimonas sp.]
MRPITDVLREMRKGRIVEDATEALHEVVKAVDATNKAGSVTLKIKVKPSKDGGWEKTLSAAISTDVPRPDMPDAVFFSNADGDLVRDDPEQTRLFEDTERPARPKAVGD